jgi:hypothetical protein
MMDQAAFWLGFTAGALAFLGLGLALGAIEFKITVTKDGVDIKKRRL